MKTSASSSYSSTQTHSLVKAGLVTALYIVLTVAVAPVGFGPIQFRISEALNYFGLYHKRYVASLTLGVMVVNAMHSTLLDVFFGTLHTLLSLLISRWLGQWIVTRFQLQSRERAVRYIVMAITFSVMMFIIAWMLQYMGYSEFFWETYLTLALSEIIVMTLGGLVFYYLIDPRLNLSE